MAPTSLRGHLLGSGDREPDRNCRAERIDRIYDDARDTRGHCRCTRTLSALVPAALVAAAGVALVAAPPRCGRAEPAPMPRAGKPPRTTRIQPRHPADPGGELLRLPRAGQCRPQGRPAARPPRGRRRGRAPSSPASRTRASWSRRIFADDPRSVMPPPKTHKKLTAAQKETLKRWIADGRRVSAALVVHRRRCGPTLPDGARTRPGSATRSTLRPRRAGSRRA